MLFGTGKYTYGLVGEWAKLPEGRSFANIGGLAIDSEDKVYVVSRGSRTQPVMVFDPDGNLLALWGEGYFKHPHGICVGPDGSVYVTDDDDHTVSKFTADGKLLMVLGSAGQPSDTGYVREQGTLSTQRGGPPFNRPTGVALASSGEIYVSDGYGNARIHKFTPTGTLLFSWGEPGAAPGRFRQPHSVRVDKQGRVWVCDRDNSRIQIFGDKGESLGEWADVGGEPSDLFFDTEGLVYVAVKSGERPNGVSVFTSNGTLLTHWGKTGDKTALFWNPHAIAVDSRGDIYLGEMRHELAKVDRGSRAVQKFARKR
ncbi:MAG: peptidyl-alpha-hydroxyglycine alpha-amidating lyase family protein [Chloroflexota bacterium]